MEKFFINRQVLQTVLIGMAVGTLVWAQSPSQTIDLTDALSRAKRYGLQLESAEIGRKFAAEDRKQARAARLPQVNILNQAIITQSNGMSGISYVASNGAHEYVEQILGRQDLLAILRDGDLRRTIAAEATAKARFDVAARGITVTVAQDYYSIVSAQRKFGNAQTSLQEAERFLDITRKQEKGGEAAHVDVIKAQLQQRQRQRDLEDAQLLILKAKIALAVLIFPDLQVNYDVVDDLGNALPMVPAAEETLALAMNTSPDLKVAASLVSEAGFAVKVARYAYLPALTVDLGYGLDANQFAYRSPDGARNLAYQAIATLSIPVWNWGAIRSRVQQAAYREQQARLDLTLAERTLKGTIATARQDIQTARTQVDSLRESSALALENVRLTLLRYQAGEATAFEVVDAQGTLALSRNAYDDGLIRYRVAVANLQILTGTL